MTGPIAVQLWDGPPPHGLGRREGVDLPFVEVFWPHPADARGAAMLIFPGGAYTFLSEKSGAQYARWLAAAGIVGIVVNFRLGSSGYRYPAILGDAWQALVLARECAPVWDIDPERIGVIGTSAGGHLAGLMVTGTAVAPDEPPPAPRPALGVLCYPVVSLLEPLAHHETRANFLGPEERDPGLQKRFSAELCVDADTAPVFVWHTVEDEEVSVDNSWCLTEALRAHGVPHEAHFYERGAHALGLARAEGLRWSDDCIRWLKSRGF